MKALFTLVFLLAAACTSSDKKNAEIARLEANLTKMAAEYDAMELKIRDAGNDPGLRSQLTNDKANLKSRMDRLKLIISTRNEE